MPGLRDGRPTDLGADSDPLDVIPAPWRIESVRGSALTLGPGTHVRVDEDPGAVGVAVILARRLGELTGCPVAVTHEDDGHPGVVDLRLVTRLVDVADDPAQHPEAYRVEVGHGRAVVSALTSHGLLRGATSLNRLLAPQPDPGAGAPHPDGLLGYPSIRIEDRPRFGWRAVALEVDGPVEPATVRRVVDLMVDLKLGVLHLPVASDRQAPGRLDHPRADRGLALHDLPEVLAFAGPRFVTVVPQVVVGVPRGPAGSGDTSPDLLDQVASLSGGGGWVGVEVGPGPASAQDTAAASAVARLHGLARRVVLGADRILPDGPAPDAVRLDAARPPRAHLGSVLAAGAGLVLVVGTGTAVEADPGPLAWARGLPADRLLGVEVRLDARAVAPGAGLRAELERLAAVAELGWTPVGPQTTGLSFARRLPALAARWHALGLVGPAPGRSVAPRS